MGRFIDPAKAHLLSEGYSKAARHVLGQYHSRNQENRLVNLYALNEVDDIWIKRQSAPLKDQRAKAEQELEALQLQRESGQTLGLLRDSLEEVCALIKTRIDSMDYEEKELALEALQVSVTLTDQKVAINSVLGVEIPDSRLPTTARTSACSPSGSYSWEWEVEYILAGVTPAGF